MHKQLGVSDSEAKILLQYPFVKDALAGKYGPGVFLENLTAFKDELIGFGIKPESIEQLKVNASKLFIHQQSQGQIIKRLNLHQRALAFSALYDDEKAVISYSPSTGNKKALQRILNSDDEFGRLVKNFRRDQKDILACLRKNMSNIMADTHLNWSERVDRLERYLPDYFEFMCILDREAFPSSGNRVFYYVPTYIPDNLSDMGSDPNVVTEYRGRREKIHIKKMEIFTQAVSLFRKIWGNRMEGKKEIVLNVAYWVYTELPYDYKWLGGRFSPLSIPLDAFKGPVPSAVCRHQALYTQVLNQSFGLTSRLLKCDMDGEPHASNLVRLDHQWHLLDVTNPILINGNPQICLLPIPERDIDLNKNTYVWRVIHDNGTRIYTSRKNMFFRIK